MIARRGDFLRLALMATWCGKMTRHTKNRDALKNDGTFDGTF